MKKNILLVEDDPSLRMVMREVLKEEFTIDEADNGADGIDMGLNRGNDLIILDYKLPKKDGLEVIEAVKGAHPDVPVIVMTGYLNPQSEKRFSQLGAEKIFPKPFNYRLLLETVRELTFAPEAQPAPVEAKSPASIVALNQLSQGQIDRQMLVDSLHALAGLAEKTEFIETLTSKCWVESGDIASIREAARCMNAEIKRFYGKMNDSLFESGQFSSPLTLGTRKPCFSGNN